MSSSEVCHDERRREAVRRADLNGIDYVEVSDDQRVISVFFLGKAPQDLTIANIRIEGGRRVTAIKVVDIRLCIEDDPDLDDCLRVFVDRPGDFSTYTLRLVNADASGRPGTTPLKGFDPRYAQIDFSFKAGCPSDLDCKADDSCPPEILVEPEISYLAKDYAGFRRLLLDRLALIMPDWAERHAPDLGITLVEVLAYVGDQLSYYQDAVATEAYLDTARQRISVRRHVRLVDYQLHEGCNARAWVCVGTDIDVEEIDPNDIFFITGHDEDLPLDTRVLDLDDLRDVRPDRYEVFEPVSRDQPIVLYQAHSSISLYTWGDRECCLPRGATSATLKDAYVEQIPPDTPPEESPYQGAEASDLTQQKGHHHKPPPPAPRPTRLKLKAGDVLIFEEVRGPVTGIPADADPAHRHAVRLTKVEYGVDTLYDQPVVEIWWDEADALPFALCISAIGRAPECEYLEDVSIARGNVVLVDHGLTVTDEGLPEVPEVTVENPGCAAEGEPIETLAPPAAYRAQLRRGPLTHRASFPMPADIARRQAVFLPEILPLVQARLMELLAQLRAGQQLSDQQIAWLRTIFSSTVIDRSGLLRQRGARPPRPNDPHEQAKALARLIGRLDTLLAGKIRRLMFLTARAEAGYVLDANVVEEIGELFGDEFAQGFSASDPAQFGPATTALQQDPAAALPDLRVYEREIAPPNDPPAARDVVWLPRLDLLQSDPDDTHFVAELDERGRAWLRFGNGTSGRAPLAGTTLYAAYRIGNGTAGNVGAETISRIVFRNAKPEGAVLEPRNPLAATGGRNPQPIAEAKMFAPGAFRSELRRAITADDYATLAEHDTRIQQAAAVLRWSGSWYEARVTLDPSSRQEADRALLDATGLRLEPYRRIGHDLAVRQARYIPLAIAVTVCVRPDYQRGQIKAALLDVFSSRLLPGGKSGFFHPDNLSFGTGIALSRIVAAALAVEGVETIQVTQLERLGQGDNGELRSGFLPIRPNEIARLDNDRNMPENGTLTFTLRGGR